jgi:hypothetical protein
VFSLRDFVWPRAAFSTAMWHAGHKVRNPPRGWSAPFCVDRKVISVKRAR